MRITITIIIIIIIMIVAVILSRSNHSWHRFCAQPVSAVHDNTGLVSGRPHLF